MIPLALDRLPLHLLQLADLTSIRATALAMTLMGVRDAVVIELLDRFDPLAPADTRRQRPTIPMVAFIHTHP
jgi:hypothetical protein